MKPMYEYFDEMYLASSEESLEHHGILGQKWGIRRFQNKDGTLTAAGKNRAKTDKDAKKQEKEEKKAAKAAAKEEKKEAKAQKAYEKERAAIEDAIANVDIKKVSELKSKMTDEDMKRLSDRALALGKLGENLGKYKKELPKSTAEKMLATLGAVKVGADAVKNAHQSIRQLKEEFGLDTKSILETQKSDSNQNGNGKKDTDKGDKKSVFDKITDFAEDVNKGHQERKFQKDLADAKRQDKDSKTLDWLKSITGSDKQQLPKANFDKGFKLGDGDLSLFKNKDTGSGSKPKANFPSPFKLGDGDTSVFKPKTESWAEKLASAGNITSVKLPDISIPSSTKSTVSRLTSKNSSTGSTPISAINDMFKGVDDLTDKWLNNK